jgi:hypothetical protein
MSSSPSLLLRAWFNVGIQPGYRKHGLTFVISSYILRYAQTNRANSDQAEIGSGLSRSHLDRRKKRYVPGIWPRCSPGANPGIRINHSSGQVHGDVLSTCVGSRGFNEPTGETAFCPAFNRRQRGRRRSCDRGRRAGHQAFLEILGGLSAFYREGTRKTFG